MCDAREYACNTAELGRPTWTRRVSAEGDQTSPPSAGDRTAIDLQGDALVKTRVKTARSLTRLRIVVLDPVLGVQGSAEVGFPDKKSVVSSSVEE